ncbi:MAG: hypothetical protein NTW21_03730 [Verrucomicrobia bacterium]|nr:hypothetical protein [Verrucomicrobiota bacterium]
MPRPPPQAKNIALTIRKTVISAAAGIAIARFRPGELTTRQTKLRK